MEMTLQKLNKIRIHRGDALGGAVPLTLINKADQISEMKRGSKGHIRRIRRHKTSKIANQLYIILTVAAVSALVAALLTEGPKL